MLTRKYDLSLSVPALPLTGAEEADSVFFDIETTGFKPETSHVYLIGAAYHGPGGWRLVQWMSEGPAEEAALLRTFDSFLKPFRTLIHFNGRRFDIPYLLERYTCHGIPTVLSDLHSVDLGQDARTLHALDTRQETRHLHSLDIYQDVRPLRSLLGLTRMNQKSLEHFLGEYREDRYDGGELIQVYRDWCRSPDAQKEKLLLLHNKEDVTGMLGLVRLYAYLQLAKTEQVGESEAWHHTLAPDNTILILHRAFSYPFPVPVRRDLPWGILLLSGDEARLEIRLVEGELYHFFPNYKDYYYLPQEDEAIHKSVAAYVDKDFRRPATARTCYTRRRGLFVPQLQSMVTPAFKREWEDAMEWFLLPDEDALAALVPAYAAHLLRNVFSKNQFRDADSKETLIKSSFPQKPPAGSQKIADENAYALRFSRGKRLNQRFPKL